MKGFLVLLAPHHPTRWATGGCIWCVKTMRYARCGNNFTFHSCGVTEHKIHKDAPKCAFPEPRMETFPKVELFFCLNQLQYTSMYAFLEEKLHWLRHLEITQIFNHSRQKKPLCKILWWLTAIAGLPPIPRPYYWTLFLRVLKGIVSSPAQFSFFCEFLGFYFFG